MFGYLLVYDNHRYLYLLFYVLSMLPLYQPLSGTTFLFCAFSLLIHYQLQTFWPLSDYCCLNLSYKDPKSDPSSYGNHPLILLRFRLFFSLSSIHLSLLNSLGPPHTISLISPSFDVLWTTSDCRKILSRGCFFHSDMVLWIRNAHVISRLSLPTPLPS